MMTMILTVKNSLHGLPKNQGLRLKNWNHSALNILAMIEGLSCPMSFMFTRSCISSF